MPTLASLMARSRSAFSGSARMMRVKAVVRSFSAMVSRLTLPAAIGDKCGAVPWLMTVAAGQDIVVLPVSVDTVALPVAAPLRTMAPALALVIPPNSSGSPKNAAAQAVARLVLPAPLMPPTRAISPSPITRSAASTPPTLRMIACVGIIIHPRIRQMMHDWSCRHAQDHVAVWVRLRAIAPTLRLSRD